MLLTQGDVCILGAQTTQKTTCRFEKDNYYFFEANIYGFQLKIGTQKSIRKALQIASKMQSNLYQKCVQNCAEIVCKNSVQIVLQKLHFLCIKKGVAK